jgi:hypothetical protein
MRVGNKLKNWGVWIAGQFFVFGVLTFVWRWVLKLSENAVVGWFDDRIGEVLGIHPPTLSAAINWGVPVALAALL